MMTLFAQGLRSRSRRSLVVVVGGLLVACCLWPTDSAGQAARKSPETSSVPVDAKLQLIGSLASSHVYTTYGYIGVVEDNIRREVYTPQRVDDLMKEVVVLTDSAVAQMEGLLKGDLTEEDAKAVREFIEIYGLLKQAANALRTYATEKTAAHEQEFLKLRSDGWVRVAKLLEIPVEEPARK